MNDYCLLPIVVCSYCKRQPSITMSNGSSVIKMSDHYIYIYIYIYIMERDERVCKSFYFSFLLHVHTRGGGKFELMTSVLLGVVSID